MTVNKLTSPISQNDLINKTNEIIDNLGGGGTVDQTYDPTSVNAQSGVAVAEAIASGKEIFIAEYNVTSFADIQTAYNAGKAVFCKYSNSIVPITNISSNTSCVFHSPSGISIRQITCDSPASWDNQLFLLERTSNKVTSITSSSTDTQYPSALAVLNILQTIYPVGCVYLTTNSTCPLSALFGTWSLVSSGRALWTGTGSNGNTIISAGLPNPTGTFGSFRAGNSPTKEGVFASSTTNSTSSAGHSSSSGTIATLIFDASNSSSIYGRSATVQPPAYVVNVFRRTA